MTKRMSLQEKIDAGTVAGYTAEACKRLDHERYTAIVCPPGYHDKHDRALEIIKRVIGGQRPDFNTKGMAALYNLFCCSRRFTIEDGGE